MKTPEAARKRRSRSAARAGCLALFAAAAAAGGCGGSATKTPSIGSESHFLAHCQASCADGLDCIGGICTRPCLTGQSSCSDLAPAAACTNQSVEPGRVAVCDVSCAGNAGCGALGSDYRCEAGFCREPVETDALASVAVDAGRNEDGPADTTGPDCESFRDQVPRPDIRMISIVNSGSVPLYIFPIFLNCGALQSLVQVQRDGTALNTLGSGELGPSCQQVIEHGPQPSEVSLCKARPPVRIDPAQTLQEAVGLEVVERQLPIECTKAASTAPVSCFSQVIPQPGAYTLTIHAALSDVCGGRGNCICDLDGQCSASDSLRAFSFQSNSYYQNQELTIAAPVN